jgi:acyl phosphate:glycerol-3-phosphate acyltransferase
VAILLVQLILTALIGYLWGSIPAGYWMGKLLRGKNFDIRDYGSHKIGATNVLRTLGRVPAAIVFAFDITKGLLPALLAFLVPFFHIAGWGLTVAALGALIGHCYPVFIGFKGGRGVATGAGALLVISPLTFLCSAVTSISTIAIWRYVSLGSIVACLTVVICGIIFFFVGWVTLAQLVYMLPGSALVIALHHDNIRRLLAGTERKIGQKEQLEEQTPPIDTPNPIQA